MSVHRVAEAAAAVTVPTWIVTVAANTLPVIQWIAAVAAIVASILASCVYVHRLRHPMRPRR